MTADADGNFSDGRFVERERDVDAERDVRAEHEVVDARGSDVNESRTQYYRAGNAATFWTRWNDSSVDEHPIREAPAIVNASPIPFRGEIRVVTVTGIEGMQHISTTDAFRVDPDLLPENDTGYTGSAVVGTDGVVYELALEKQRAGADATEIRWQLRDVGDTEVEPPDWLEHHRTNRTAS